MKFWSSNQLFLIKPLFNSIYIIDSYINADIVVLYKWCYAHHYLKCLMWWLTRPIMNMILCKSFNERQMIVINPTILRDKIKNYNNKYSLFILIMWYGWFMIHSFPLVMELFVFYYLILAIRVQIGEEMNPK